METESVCESSADPKFLTQLWSQDSLFVDRGYLLPVSLSYGKAYPLANESLTSTVQDGIPLVPWPLGGYGN